MSLACSEILWVAEHPERTKTLAMRRFNFGLDLVQPAVNRFLLGNQLHEQTVVREVRAAKDGEQGQGNADDSSPVACRQANDVVMLKGHLLLLIR